MMNRAILGSVIGFVGMTLAVSGQTAVGQVETTPSVGELQEVRLHFTTFSKSKSGAT